MDDYKIIVDQEPTTVMVHYEVEQKPDEDYNVLRMMDIAASGHDF